MNLQQLLLILKARYKIALFTMLLITGATLALSLVLPARYSASTTVVVDVRAPDLLSQVAMLTGDMPSYLPTQVDIINSDRVVQKVISQLRLDESPAVRERWLTDAEGKGSMLAWLGALIQKDMKAKPSRDSNVITITYTSTDPNFSAAVANAFAQAYIDTIVELKAEPAKNYSQWFLDQGKGLRENLEKAQAKLSDYQKKHGIVVTDERLDSETAKLAELTSQLTMIQALNADAQSKQRAGSNASTLPEVAQNGLIMNLKADIDRLEAKLRNPPGNLGRNHPQFKNMQAELAMLKEKLAEETQHLSTGFVTSESVGQDKAGTIRAMIEAQKQRLLDMRQQRNEAEVLVGEVNNAQKAYDAVTQRFTQTSLEAQARQTNISVLGAASAPIKPSSPLPVLYTLIAAILGTIIGIGIAFLREMVDRRVRTIEDIELGIGLPVLARITRQKNGRLGLKKLRLRKPRTIEFA
jgi:polysaccharide biosynthesis transport protein